MMSQESKFALIRARMERAQKTIDDNNGWGPTLTIVVGFILVLGLVGIPIILLGLVWSHINQKAREAALVDYKDAEKELFSM